MDIIPVTFLISTYYTSAYRYYTNIFFSVIQQPSTPPFCPRFPSWEKSCRDFLGRKGEEFQVTIPGSWAQPKIPQVLWRVGLSWHPYQTSFCVYFTVFFTVKTFLKPFYKQVTGLKLDYYCTDQAASPATAHNGIPVFVLSRRATQSRTARSSSSPKSRASSKLFLEDLKKLTSLSRLTCPRIVFSFKLPHLKTNRSEQCPALASTFKTFQNAANRHFYQTPLHPQWRACSGFDQKLRGCNHQNGGIFSSRWSLDGFLGKTAGHVHVFTIKLMRFHVLPLNKPLLGMEQMYQSLAF